MKTALIPEQSKVGKQFRLELFDSFTNTCHFYECWIEPALKSSDSYLISGKFGIVGKTEHTKAFGISGFEACLKRAASLKEVRNYSGYIEVLG